MQLDLSPFEVITPIGVHLNGRVNIAISNPQSPSIPKTKMAQQQAAQLAFNHK